MKIYTQIVDGKRDHLIEVMEELSMMKIEMIADTLAKSNRIIITVYEKCN